MNLMRPRPVRAGGRSQGRRGDGQRQGREGAHHLCVMGSRRHVCGMGGCCQVTREGQRLDGTPHLTGMGSCHQVSHSCFRLFHHPPCRAGAAEEGESRRRPP